MKCFHSELLFDKLWELRPSRSVFSSFGEVLQNSEALKLNYRSALSTIDSANKGHEMLTAPTSSTKRWRRIS
jgi:hypothetical protein